MKQRIDVAPIAFATPMPFTRYATGVPSFAFQLFVESQMQPMPPSSAMPADIGPGALFYRKDLTDKAGVAAPTKGANLLRHSAATAAIGG